MSTVTAKSLFTHGLRARRGQALVEMALMTPLLIFIASGVIESGRAFSAHEQLVNAAREGVRAGSLTPADTSTIESVTRREVPEWINANIIAIVVSCAPAGSDTFDLCLTSYTPASGDKLKVTVTYAYQPIMPIINGLASIVALDMSGSAVMQVQ